MACISFASLRQPALLLFAAAHATASPPISAPLTQALLDHCRPGQDVIGGSAIEESGASSSSDQECNQRCHNRTACTAWIRPSGVGEGPCFMVAGAVNWTSRLDRNAGRPGCIGRAAGGSDGAGSLPDDGKDEDGFLPLRGICYAPLPCLKEGCSVPEDMAQEAYKQQWGADGRDDLGIMKRMGANVVRLYHPIGEPGAPQPDSKGFLDASEAVGLKVFGAVHQYLTCTAQDDCYESWFQAMQDGLASGFARGGAWHPAVWAFNLINEVDAHVPFTDPVRQVKRLISAADGLIAAEKAAQIRGNVNLTSCFTTAMAPTYGGPDQPWTVYHGFLSMDLWIKNPALVDYKPRSGSIADLAKELDKRWIHCINAQIPWEYGLKGMLADHYAPLLPRPWFIGEMGFNGAHTDTIERELEAMHKYALEGHGFLGTFFFQFQTAYFKWGPELNFGMFGLGAAQMGTTGELRGQEFPVHCLTSRQWAFEQPGSACKDECNHRAKAVAKAFGGEISGSGVCLEEPPLGQTAKRRRLRHDSATQNDFYQ